MLGNEKGQTLLELIVVIAVGIIVVGALTFATVASLKNAQFSKNQSLATKTAQEGVEKVRSIRDRDGVVIFTYGSNTTAKFSDLWSAQMSSSCNPCSFLLTAGTLNNTSFTTFENLENGLQRQVQISDDQNWAQEKKVTVIVRWTDFSGNHESKLATILRKI